MQICRNIQLNELGFRPAWSNMCIISLGVFVFDGGSFLDILDFLELLGRLFALLLLLSKLLRQVSN